MHFQAFSSALALLSLPLVLSFPLEIRDTTPKAAPVVQIHDPPTHQAAAAPAPAAASPAAAASAPKVAASGHVSAAQILTIAPKSASCAAAGQCRTNKQAELPINNAFDAFSITSAGEKAAVISIMAFESGDFKYDAPIVAVAGKGTRNMQSATFNQKYAASIPGLKATSDPDAIVKQLNSNDYYSFGSGAWFLKTQCSPEIRTGLASGSLDGWTAYITKCVQTTVTPDRQAGWQRAITALKSA